MFCTAAGESLAAGVAAYAPRCEALARVGDRHRRVSPYLRPPHRRRQCGDLARGQRWTWCGDAGEPCSPQRLHHDARRLLAAAGTVGSRATRHPACSSCLPPQPHRHEACGWTRSPPPHAAGLLGRRAAHRGFCSLSVSTRSAGENTCPGSPSRSAASPRSCSRH